MRGSEGEKVKESLQARNSPSPVVCILLMSVTYSTHTNVKPVVHRYDLDMTVYRLCSG